MGNVFRKTRSDIVKRAELLAPVGSLDALKSAVQNGADAVYLGGKNFGARQYADNFGEKELKEAVQYCHIRDTKVYITVNTLIDNSELKEFMEYINYLYNIDVDAIIVQDLGALKYIREEYPDLEVHASTQMTIHNLEGLRLLKELGIKRVVLARELGIEEIKKIKGSIDMELEVFVHGALCVCYSGQCLMSSLIGGRSGNRGRCAQPCRLPYKLIDINTGKEMENTNGDYILSPRDLNTIENIGQLLELGIDSLKIEGRMKKPEYVATVVRHYKEAMETYYRNKKSTVTEDTKKELQLIFNRRFTKGYLFNEKGKKLMNFEQPGNIGVKISSVEAYIPHKNRLRMKLEHDLKKGDGIKINSKEKETGAKVNEIYYGDKKVEEAYQGQTIEIYFKDKVEIGAEVFKTSDVELINKAKKSYERENKEIFINGVVKGKLGDPMEAYIWDDRGNYGRVLGKINIEKAKNTPIDEKRIEQQMKKLGDTPYSFESLKIDIDQEISVPLSEINSIRRAMIESLNHQREKINKREEKVINAQNLIVDKLGKKKSNQNKKVLITGVANDHKQLEALLSTDIDVIYYKDFIDLEMADELSEEYNKVLIPALSRISKDIDIEKRKDIYPKNILVGNLGQLNLYKEKDINIYSDFSFNVFNSLTVRKLEEIGVSTVTLSPELTMKQIREITKYGNVDYEVIVYGHLPMMITEFCPMSIIKKDDKDKNCNICKETKYGLQDRYGFVFPIEREGSCRVNILNSQKLFALEFLGEIIDSNINQIRLQFTNEDKNEIINIVNAYKNALENVLNKGRNMTPEVEELIQYYKSKQDYTKGHFFRGVL